MNCPYCAEEIKDAAFVCRFCNRDLTFFKAHNTRIAQLEAAVLALEESVAALGAVRPATQTTKVAEPEQRQSSMLVLVAGSALIALGTYFSDFQTEIPLGLLLMFGPSLALALYLAIFGGYQRVWPYVRVGLIQVPVQTIAIIIAEIKRHGPAGFKNELWEYLFFGPLVFAVTSGLLFLSVGLLRKYLKRSRMAFSRDDAPARLAVGVLKVLPGTPTDNRWKRTADFTAALGPVLTLIGSIVVAYFGYLAAAAKRQ